MPVDIKKAINHKAINHITKCSRGAAVPSFASAAEEPSSSPGRASSILLSKLPCPDPKPLTHCNEELHPAAGNKRTCAPRSLYFPSQVFGSVAALGGATLRRSSLVSVNVRREAARQHVDFVVSDVEPFPVRNFTEM